MSTDVHTNFFLKKNQTNIRMQWRKKGKSEKLGKSNLSIANFTEFVTILLIILVSNEGYTLNKT